MDYKNDYDYDYDDVSNIISTNIINHCLFSSTSTSPPTTPTATTTTATTTTTTDESTPSGSGLYRARLILENRLYNELLNRYQLAISRLRQLSNEATALKEENEWLKLVNEDLIRRFNRRFPVRDEPWVGPTAAASGWSSSSSSGGGDHQQNGVLLGGEYSSHTTVIDDDEGHDDDDDDDNDDDDDERFSLPKSISVRSPGFFKLVNSPVITNNQSQSPLQHVNGTKLKVRKEEKAIEMEVFNQGMYKTELCNKWEETRTCPYGQHCQFAHGLSELRPVIRHPRYKTQICRMVVAGVTCPYGHRCHFRHSLS